MHSGETQNSSQQATNSRVVKALGTLDDATIVHLSEVINGRPEVAYTTLVRLLTLLPLDTARLQLAKLGHDIAVKHRLVAMYIMHNSLNLRN